MREQNTNSSSHDRMAYRVAVRLFNTAFAALERLPQDDQQSLLSEMGKRLLQRMPQSSPETTKPIQIVGVEIRSQPSTDPNADVA